VRVIELRAIGGGGFDVRLEPSAARHQLHARLFVPGLDGVVPPLGGR
jgi:hypothetical protein